MSAFLVLPIWQYTKNEKNRTVLWLGANSTAQSQPRHGTESGEQEETSAGRLPQVSNLGGIPIGCS